MTLPASQPGAGNWWDGRSLRFRVLAGLIGIMLIAFTIIGAVTVVALNRFLLGRLDQQLMASNSRYVAAATDPHDQAGAGSGVNDGDGDGDDGFGDARGQAADTLGARIAGGRIVTFGIVGRPLSGAVPTAEQRNLLNLPLGHSASRDLGTFGDYRLRATTLPDGDRLIVGLPLRPVHETLAELLTVELAVFGFVLVATLLASGWLLRLSFRPLTRITATARRVTESDLTVGDPELTERVPTPEPATEVGQLGVAFNHMLDHVEVSLLSRRDTEDRLRQFIADASHELRTPVASIRGHAESVRHLREELPPDVLQSLSRIESEAQRMGVLVDDLLLLARLDTGRSLAHEPVDLSRIVIDATSDARTVGRDHDWSLNLPKQPVVVSGDDHRLHEAVTNLLTNARTHTPPGSRVTVTMTTDGADALLIIGDNGPGIPSDVQDHVFERFYRVHPGRAPMTGSSGLGLAIVAAVVDAHGGTVSLASDPGDTRFTIHLPLATDTSPVPHSHHQSGGAAPAGAPDWLGSASSAESPMGGF
jgi:two-component system, OmpR family, sensor kinase